MTDRETLSGLAVAAPAEAKTLKSGDTPRTAVGEAVFKIRRVSKVYRMGEVEVTSPVPTPRCLTA